MTRPRILHIVPSPFSENGVVGGAERYALELARHMAESVPTTLVTFGDKSSTEHIGPLRIRTLGNAWYIKGNRTNPLAWGLFRELLSADIVHCHQRRVLSSSLSALLCLPFRRRVFVSDLGGSGWDISFRLSTERWYTGHLHISDYSRQISGHMDKPWAHVIMGGVDTVKFSPKPSVEKDGVVRFVGRILPHKGVDDLIRALPPDMSLEIIGKAYDRPFLDHLQSLAAGKRVSFRHDCQDDNLVEAYRQALCVVLPSVYVSSYNGSETRIPELLGQTLLEAMACGSPAICTDVASMPELVMDSVTGFVTPPNNPDALQEKLMWLRDHPAQAAEMGRAARNHVTAHFKWSTIVDRCIKHYGIEKDA